eukprot:scaffold75408_cov31-Tisochrysis_lutea.AAC.1
MSRCSSSTATRCLIRSTASAVQVTRSSRIGSTPPVSPKIIWRSAGMMRTSLISSSPGRDIRFLPPPKRGLSSAPIAASSSCDIPADRRS